MSGTGKRRTLIDLIVIGADAAGVAAAACAARQGAAVALVRGGERKPRAGSVPGVPDFVWRKLNLEEWGLDAEPVSSRVSLFEEGRWIATYASAKRTREALEKSAEGDHHLWTDFVAELERRWREGADVAYASAAGGGGTRPLLDALRREGGAAAAGRLAGTTAGLLEDYFVSDELKTHLASVALGPFGLGGDEPGSALGLAALSEGAAWRVRPGGKAGALLAALDAAADAAGVLRPGGRLKALGPADAKKRSVVLEDGEIVEARRIMAASVDVAARADVEVAPSFSPLTRREGAVADIRLRFKKTPEAPVHGRDAVYFIADSLQSFAEARDAALEGRITENMPISFEYARDEIVVHAPYCPTFLKTEDEIRDWSEQDRQALGMAIVRRLEPFLNGASKSIKRIDIRVTPAAPPPGDEGPNAVPAPPPGQDPIGAAARLALELVSGR
jgi:phytoene dehydrogenase-like protein